MTGWKSIINSNYYIRYIFIYNRATKKIIKKNKKFAKKMLTSINKGVILLGHQQKMQNINIGMDA